jgi:hypothetical protein
MNDTEGEAATPEEVKEIEEMASIGYTVVQAALEGTPSIVLPKEEGYVVLLLIDAPPSVRAALDTFINSAHITIPLAGTEEEVEKRLKAATFPPHAPDDTWTQVVKGKK